MKKLTLARLVSLRRIRWGALVAVLLVGAWACISHPLTQPRPQPVQESDAQVTIVPMRHLDLLFMVDNSPSMKPKQDKMKAQFPRLIEALRDRDDGSLPDLRVAILDSDVGAGRSTSACAERPNGDLGIFQMRDGAGCGANPDAKWLEFNKGQAVNYTGDLSTVFGCLATNLGVGGCGFEHQLSVFEWAFYLGSNESQKAFLRPEAYLGVVILTDEDDCSAPSDTSMYNTNQRAEAWSLRCATRGHECDDTSLAYPTTGPISVPYASCRARMDASCDTANVDTSVATTCNPLVSIKELASAIKQLKSDDPALAEEKILVAGIYGRQRDGDTSVPAYKIDLTPDPNKPDDPNAKVWDYWPICYDPDFPPSGSGFDKTAAEHGATGGLRLDAFLAQFPEKNRRAYSICERDFGPAMQGIGEALDTLMGDLCVPYKLVDKSKDPGLQADCRVAFRIPRTVEKDGKVTVTYEERAESLPACDGSGTVPCWEVIMGNASGSAVEKEAARKCPVKGSLPSQMVHVVRAPNDDLPDGTKAVMQCLTCVDSRPDVVPTEGCDY
jgi:hypothetical protein